MPFIHSVCYSPSVVTMAVSLAISEIFSIKEWPDLEMWVWGCSRSLKMVGGKVICIPVALPASISANTPAERNHRFHLRTESLWVPVKKPGRIPPITPTWAFKHHAAQRRGVVSSKTSHHFFSIGEEEEEELKMVRFNRPCVTFC